MKLVKTFAKLVQSSPLHTWIGNGQTVLDVSNVVQDYGITTCALLIGGNVDQMAMLNDSAKTIILVRPLHYEERAELYAVYEVADGGGEGE